MSNIQLTVEQTLISEEILARYPGLRHLPSTRIAMIEDALEYIAQESHTSAGTLIDQVVKKFKQAPLEEAVNLYNHAVKDGRFISLLATDPKKAAELLELKVSDEAVAALEWIISRVDKAPSIAGFGPKPEVVPVAIPIGIGVAVVVGVAIGGGALGWWAAGPPHAQAEMIAVVVDRSGQVKL
jgi:hypothetical protein